MIYTWLCRFLFLALIAIGANADTSASFFSVHSIQVRQKPDSKDNVDFELNTTFEKNPRRLFRPYVKAALTTQEQIFSMDTFARAYFFSKDMRLIARLEMPTQVDRNDGSGMTAMPVFFSREKREYVYFALPREVLVVKNWSVLIVFGDKHGATATLYPRRSQAIADLDFPEKTIVINPLPAIRKKVINPVIEYTVKTGITKYPQLTLFLRKPFRSNDFSDTQGVLALCILANSVAEIKKQLQEADAKSELGAIFNFAEKNKLAILCWGARSLWNPKANWNELKRQEYARMDDIFDDVAHAWGKAVGALAKKYGLPTNGYLLMGYSGSAQYVARLALRQPQYFLAVHIHIPSSFDRPTLKANRVMWCLTTGEEESGYERSLAFLAECQKMRYPMIYKAIPRLGHSSHPTATRLGLTFFEYALSQKKKSGNIPCQNTSRTYDDDNLAAQWEAPAYWGDIFRQQIYPSNMSERPPAVLVPLPSDAIAQAWAGQ